MIDCSRLTDQEVEFILERFDQTEPKLQRRIVATVCVHKQELIQLAKESLRLLEFRLECADIADDEKSHLIQLRRLIRQVDR